MKKLLWHPESDCLFWGEKEDLDEGLVNEIGESETPTEDEAKRILFEEGHFDMLKNFAAIYKQ